MRILMYPQRIVSLGEVNHPTPVFGGYIITGLVENNSGSVQLASYQTSRETG